MFGPEYFRTMAYQNEDSTLICEDCFKGDEDGWDRVTENMLDDMTHEDPAENEEDPPFIIRPTCDECGRAYVATKGEWMEPIEISEED
jgi:hypothetical protein